MAIDQQQVTDEFSELIDAARQCIATSGDLDPPHVACFKNLMNAAASALSRDPDIVIEDSDIEGGEYWQKVCELADQGGKPREGVYVADITAIMDSPEVSADRGGKLNMSYLPHYDYWVRCELLLCLNPCYTGGRWLAVYEVKGV